jgi:two-component system sensor histidine kinase CiaH
MFRSTRIKLTAWYLLIIMLISMLFSVVIYANVNSDLLRLEERQRRFLERQRVAQALIRQLVERGVVVPHVPMQNIDANLQEIAQARNRLILVLTAINLGILGISGIAGYFLAGRTLRPIREMVTEQQRFIADASHELRTPLTSLRSEMEVNLSDKKLTLTEAKKVIASNLEDVIKLQELSDNLIELAQFEDVAKQYSFANITTCEVIESAIKKVAGLAKRRRVKMQTDIASFPILGNFTMLSQLFSILLENAIKYSDREGLIKITTRKIDHHVAISVIDNGIGIDKKDIPYIFDRFYRGDKSRAKNIRGGYGLGLSIAQKIVHKHKGKIRALSTVHKGTTFIVELPIVKVS